MSKIDIALSEFEEKTNVILERVKSLTRDQVDWKLELPLGDDYWSIRQILAHIDEVNDYWISCIKSLLVEPLSQIGRSPEAMDARTRAIDSAYDRELSEILDCMVASTKRVRDEFDGILDEQYENIAGIFEHVYPEHVDEHLKQIERTLFAYSQYH